MTAGHSTVNSYNVSTIICVVRDILYRTYFLSRHIPFVYFTSYCTLLLLYYLPYFESRRSSFDLILSSNASLFTLGNRPGETPVWEKTATNPEDKTAKMIK